MKKILDKKKHVKTELDDYYQEYHDWCLNWYEPSYYYESSLEYHADMWYHDYLNDEIGIRNRKLNSLLDIENDGPIIYNSNGMVFHPDEGYIWRY